MKPLLFTLLFCLFSFTTHAFPCKVVKVSDGDTITCLKNGNSQVKIRLYGIDAPEKKQAFGQQSRLALAHLLAGKIVEIEDCGPDRYGRIIGIIKSGGTIINRQMIQDGYAWLYPAFCRRPECSEWKTQEELAKAARRGLWRGNKPISPWQWRKKARRSHFSENTQGSAKK